MALKESTRSDSSAAFDFTLEAGRGFSRVLKKGEVFRIVDVRGNQAVDTLFYSAEDPTERYSATDTIRHQKNVFLTTGSELLSNEGRVMLTIVADTCGRHDTLGGACAAESNQVRYSLDKKYMHNCRDSFLLELQKHLPHMTLADLTANINFFMNVPITSEGKLWFADGISGEGRYVEMQAEMNVIVLISNCPQLNNPCNAYNPTEIRLLVWNQ